MGRSRQNGNRERIVTEKEREKDMGPVLEFVGGVLLHYWP